MRATCDKFKGLRVSFAGGSIKFVDGAAEVDVVQADHLLRLPEHYGVAVERDSSEVEDSSEENQVQGSTDPSSDSNDSAAEQQQPPADNEHVDAGAELFEPKGNASVEEWRAYAVQKGKNADDVAELKREEIKALLDV